MKREREGKGAGMEGGDARRKGVSRKRGVRRVAKGRKKGDMERIRKRWEVARGRVEAKRKKEREKGRV